MIHKPLPPSTTRNHIVVLTDQNGLVLHIFHFCLEFLYQVGASSANSYPGAGEHKGHFLEINTWKIGRHSTTTDRRAAVTEGRVLPATRMAPETCRSMRDPFSLRTWSTGVEN